MSQDVHYVTIGCRNCNDFYTKDTTHKRATLLFLYRQGAFMTYDHRLTQKKNVNSERSNGGIQLQGASSNQDLLAMISSARQGSYQVRPGDSLWGIAQSLGMPLADLMSANGLNQWSVIHPGQELKTSGGAQSSTHNSNSSHIVKPGDSLWTIAEDHGVSFQQIQAANPNVGSLIHPGDQINIPSNGHSGVASSSSQSSHSTSSSSTSSSSTSSNRQSGGSQEQQSTPSPTPQNQRNGYDPALGKRLAQASSSEAGGKWKAGGMCYHSVANAVDRVIGRFLYGGHAYMAASQLAARKDLFTEVPATDLKSLPAGAIVVWGKGSSESGHISIAQGNGMETSDFIGHQMTYHYGGASARVFLPKGVMR